MTDKYVTPVTKTRIELIKRLIDASFDEIDHSYTSVYEDFLKLNDRYNELLGISDAMKKENEALKARLAQYEEGRPMETAPRDGTDILIEGPAGCYDICSCSYQYYDLWIVSSSGDIISFENAIRWWPLPGNTPSETQKPEQDNNENN